VAAASLTPGDQAVRGEVVRQLQTVVSPTIAAAIEDIVKYTKLDGHGVFATAVGVVLLFFAALSFFRQLQDSLNTIWGVRVKDDCGYWTLIWDRVLSFVMVLIVTALLLTSLVASTVVQTMAKYVHVPWAVGGVDLWRVVNWVVTFLLVTVMFALIYKWLPDVKLSWRDVSVGAAMTAILFTLGNYVIGLYLSHTTTVSAYGAAGSLVAVLLWVYYSSQVLLFGAEFTQVYATKYGRPLIADNIAEPQGDKDSTKRLAARFGDRREEHALSH
jgi:membrane protein